MQECVEKNEQGQVETFTFTACKQSELNWSSGKGKVFRCDQVLNKPAADMFHIALKIVFLNLAQANIYERPLP